MLGISTKKHIEIVENWDLTPSIGIYWGFPKTNVSKWMKINWDIRGCNVGFTNILWLQMGT
jgi:hypothetical protein